MNAAGLRINCVVPKYNCAAYFSAAIESLRGQSRALERIVISENHSTDGSRDATVALNGTGNVSVVVPPEHINNMGGNLAFALEHLPDADYTLIASADDIWDRDFVRELVEQVLQANPRALGVFSDRWIIDENDRLTGCTGSVRHPLVSGRDDWGYYLEACRFIFSGALFKTAPLKKMARLIATTGQSADWVLIAEMARLGSIVYYPRPLWRFRIHSSSTSATRKQGHADNLRNYAGYLSDLGERDASARVAVFADALASKVDDPASGWSQRPGGRDPHSRGKIRVWLGGLVHGTGVSKVFCPLLRRIYKNAHAF